MAKHMRDVAERDETIHRLQRELTLQTHEARLRPQDELEFMYLGMNYLMCDNSCNGCDRSEFR